MTPETSGLDGTLAFSKVCYELARSTIKSVRMGFLPIPNISELNSLIARTVGTPNSKIYALELIHNLGIDPDQIVQGKSQFSELPNQLGINISRGDYGLFDRRGARRFEAQTIFTRLTVLRRLRQEQFQPDIIASKIEFYENWAAEYLAHYGIPYNHPENLTAAIPSRSERELWEGITQGLIE